MLHELALSILLTTVQNPRAIKKIRTTALLQATHSGFNKTRVQTSFISNLKIKLRSKTISRLIFCKSHKVKKVQLLFILCGSSRTCMRRRQTFSSEANIA